MYEYDVTLSFAGEDRKIVEEVAEWLKFFGLSVFYDEWESHNLIGEDLFQHLSKTYSDDARLCLVFCSKHYVGKMWTEHELKFAQARLISSTDAYLIPIRIDDTPIPGVPKTTGFLDLRKSSASRIATTVAQKLNKFKPLEFSRYLLSSKKMHYRFYQNGSLHARASIDIIWTSSISDHYVTEIWSPDGSELDVTSFNAFDDVGRLDTQTVGQSRTQFATKVKFRKPLKFGDSVSLKINYRCKNYFEYLTGDCSDDFKIGVATRQWQYKFDFPSAEPIAAFFFNLEVDGNRFRQIYETSIEGGRQQYTCNLSDPPVGARATVSFSI